MIRNFSTVVMLAIGCCMLFSGCALSSPSAEQQREQEFKQAMNAPVEGAISFHTLLVKSKDPANELTVHSFYGETVLIEKLPWLTSLEIQDIIPVERPLKVRGIYDLKLQLSDKGREQWDAMVKNDSPDGEGFAVLVDGIFYVAIHPRRFYKESSREIMLDGPFDQVLAMKLNKNAPFNFLKLKKAAKEQQQKKSEKSAK